MKENKWYNTNKETQSKILKGGKIVVVAPKDHSNIVPLFCRLCNFPTKTSDDAISTKKHGCCSSCEDRWSNWPNVNLNKKQYPDKNSEEWNEYIQYRLLQWKPIIRFE